MWRGALIGFGNVAVHGHLPGWSRRGDVDIVAVADTRPIRRAEAAASVPGARWYDSAEALLAAEPLDFVDICTPPSSHATLAQHALESGVHVLCEKPLVGSPDELRRLARAARGRGRIVHTVHNWNQAPIVRRTRELIGTGVVGEVTAVVWHTLRTRPATVVGADLNWRVDPAVAGGGVLTDHGWHVFYIVQGWIGHAPVAVSAALETRRHHAFPVEDTASVQITFPAAKADIFLTWASDARRNWAEVSGTEGVLQILDDTIVVQSRRTGEEHRWRCPPRLSDGSQHPDWFDAVANEFVAVMGAGDPGASNFVEASWCVALGSAARVSDRQGGRPVRVEVRG
ncbi:MAG: Gfo/Idh/MocA family protein [Candidatus Rokuibacteriota bacterium]